MGKITGHLKESDLTSFESACDEELILIRQDEDTICVCTRSYGSFPNKEKLDEAMELLKSSVSKLENIEAISDDGKSVHLCTYLKIPAESSNEKELEILNKVGLDLSKAFESATEFWALVKKYNN